MILKKKQQPEKKKAVEWESSSLIAAVASSLSAAATWFVSRKKRKNDFIQSLQNSIDLLAERYNKTLEELCKMKQANIELSVKIQTLIHENEELKEKISSLLAKVEK